MDCMTILAQATRNASPEAAEQAIVPIDLFWKQITSLGMLEALTFISFGVVCLFYGWRVFKVLVVINFGLLGLVLGMAIAEKIVGVNNQLTGGLIGMGLLAVLSVPLMRWAVCLLGAAAGGILTSGIWYACGLTETYIWAGALIGIVAGGMMGFIVFKAAVILFSSLWGSGLTVVGALALLYLYDKTAEPVEALVFNLKWFLPTVLTVPTLIGVILQHKFVKSAKDWDL
ncbi:MAG: hypothetical protein ABIF19_19720 [Planctomycetota bacterium]